MSVVLAGRRVVLGVSGGIAAYKAVDVCRRLMDGGAHVAPVLTEDAQRFIGALTFSALASEPARTSLFDGPEPIPHTRLGQGADVVVVVPATAKLLAKYAAGMSDDLLTATLLATRAPVVVCPAMHTEMWDHPAVQANLEVLAARGVHVVDPQRGRLAGGDEGEGRLADPARIVEAVEAVLVEAGPLARRSVLVTAGGTRERLDPVRYIGNRSSGRMGHALAETAFRRGAAVTLITTSNLASPPGIERIEVESARQMHEAVLTRVSSVDVLVMAAAVADFAPKVQADRKLKKSAGPPEVVLEPTPDILEAVRGAQTGAYVVGFAAETDHVREHAEAKLQAKGVDLMVANDVAAPDSGFEVDTNRATLLDPSGGVDELGLMSKHDVAGVILDRVRLALDRRDNQETTS